MVVWCWVEVSRRVMVESAPDEERVMEIGVAGWWRWTLRDWQDDMRKRQRRRGSLLRRFSKLSMDSFWYAMGKIGTISISGTIDGLDGLGKQTYRQNLPLGRR